ncbi:MAG: UDP-N-acetylmuramoyl-L-alanyl-D-glutamate--2,6-diaminopimelate ligase [Patescibacteria group bacterium]
MKACIKKFVPKPVLRRYHWSLARLGALLYRHPSRKLVVIGVTGTKGKSTTAAMAAAVLEGAGKSVGLISTIKFKVAKKEWPNETKQTMPGRFRLQQLLSRMVSAGCTYAVIETSSEGVAQYRHLGIDYDVAVFTNLSPEHIEAHGSYEQYRHAKLMLFRGLQGSYRKSVGGGQVQKKIIVNADDEEAERFLSCSSDEEWAYGLKSRVTSTPNAVRATGIAESAAGVSFEAAGRLFNLHLLGEFNVYNALAALTVGLSQGVSAEVCKRALENIPMLPGRLEEIKNNRGFRVFVDYAHEPASLEAAYRTLRRLDPSRMISVLGSQGGGRDKAKRPLLGRLASQYTDFVIVTNEDPYDEDPQRIIDDVMAGALDAGKEPDRNCWSVLDRRAALEKAVSLARAGDIVIVTGKGSETVMAVAGGRKVPWDDRKELRQLVNG